MPVFSYIVYPAAGRKNNLINRLSEMEGCTVYPAEDSEVLLLVTDTPDEKSEKYLQKRLKQIETLQSMSMTFGHVDETVNP